MRAMQIIEWGKPLEAREYPDPEPEGEEVLLRVEAAGVCHSDVHIWDGHFDLGGGQQISLESRGVRLPFTMGHEIAGEVAAFGPQASGVKVGDKVVAYPWIGCGECAVCRRGEELLCLQPRTLGTRRAGGYGTHVIVPHGRYLLPHEGVPQGLAATYTCSGITAFSALKKTRSHLGTDDHLSAARIAASRRWTRSSFIASLSRKLFESQDIMDLRLTRASLHKRGKPMAGFDPTSPLLVRAGKVRSGADTAVRSRSRGRAAWVEVGLCCAGKLMHAYLNTAGGQPQPIRSDASRLADPVVASGGLLGERESTKCNHDGEHRHIGYL